VRHGEREDHVDPNIGIRSLRPHDCRITADGKDMAKKLGVYMIGGRCVDPKKVVILTSPLQRCVQTAHAIAEGLTVHGTDAAANEELLKSIPIFVEPGLVEGVYWMHHDIRRNTAITGSAYPPQPIYESDDYLRRNVSFLVRLPNDDSQSALCQAPVYGVDHSTGLLTEEVPVATRCKTAALKLAYNKQFAGKVVICVGHGQTSTLWFNALVGLEHSLSDTLSPPYTGVAELMPALIQENEKDRIVWHSQIEPFGRPHLGTHESAL